MKTKKETILQVLLPLGQVGGGGQDAGRQEEPGGGILQGRHLQCGGHGGKEGPEEHGDAGPRHQEVGHSPRLHDQPLGLDIRDTHR